MKKFIISEEEKSRILGMHQDATKRHYLKEQQSKQINYQDQNLLYKILNTGDAMFKKGMKNSAFIIPEQPKRAYSYNFTNEKINDFGSGAANTGLEVFVAVLLANDIPQITMAGILNIAKDSSDYSKTPKLKSEFDDYYKASKATKDSVWPVGVLPKDIVEKLYTNLWNGIQDDSTKQQIKQFVANRPQDYSPEYKQFISNLS